MSLFYHCCQTTINVVDFPTISTIVLWYLDWVIILFPLCLIGGRHVVASLLLPLVHHHHHLLHCNLPSRGSPKCSGWQLHRGFKSFNVFTKLEKFAISVHPEMWRLGAFYLEGRVSLAGGAMLRFGIQINTLRSPLLWLAIICRKYRKIFFDILRLSFDLRILKSFFFDREWSLRFLTKSMPLLAGGADPLASLSVGERTGTTTRWFFNPHNTN